MQLKLTRLKSDDRATIGFLSIDDDPAYFGLEDAHHDKKIPGKTRIPMGHYEIKLRDAGGMTKRYAADYGDDFHKGMLHLQDVPGFEWVYIHTGNDEDDTEGCILVGVTANLGIGRKSVGNSRAAYRQIYPKVRDAILAGEKVTIQVIDEA